MLPGPVAVTTILSSRIEPPRGLKPAAHGFSGCSNHRAGRAPSMPHEYFVIDAFSGEAFGGNPAAVVLDADDLSDERMKAIAAEFNLSETTFVLSPESGGESNSGAPFEAGLSETTLLGCAERGVTALARDELHRGGDEVSDSPEGGVATRTTVATSTRAAARPSTTTRVRFRWFTPSVEVRMCGHASVAAVRAMLECGRIRVDDSTASTVIEIETLSGLLRAYLERIPGRTDDAGYMIWLDLPRPSLAVVSRGVEELIACLRIGRDDIEPAQPLRRTTDDDLLLFVRDAAALHGITPDHLRLKELMVGQGVRGVGVATVKTHSPAIHVQSRFFAPASGIDEDPVTGSLHGPLAACLAERGLVEFHDGLGAITCVQSKVGSRSGVLHALVQRHDGGGYDVRIGGQAVTVMRGWLHA